MPTILLIDTAFETCRVGLARDGKILARRETQSGGAHDRVLAGMAAELFAEQNIDVKKLDTIMVTTGPGRFTGLRVGIAFARGLSLVHEIPLIGVNTMDAIAWDLKQLQKLNSRAQSRDLPLKNRDPSASVGDTDVGLAILVGVKRGQSFVRYVGEDDIRVVEDADLAAELSACAPLVVAGVLSDAAQNLFPLDGVAWEKSALEPSLEAVLASAAAESGENPVVRPYYAA